MKKLLVVVLVIFGLLLWLWWPEPQPLLPTAGTNVVVFGDSLAAGTGASPGNDIASQLEKELDRTVINLGVPGDTSADGLARLNEVYDVDPRVVVILLGGNDALKRKPVAETFANLGAIIEAIQARGAAVVLIGEPGGLYGTQYEKEYKRLAATYRTFYVSNILSGLIGRDEYMSDLIHPNDAGYTRAVERILPVVESALADEQ